MTNTIRHSILSIAIVLALAGAPTLAASQSALDLTPLENLPIQEGGRKKSFYAFANERLLGISGTTRLEFDGNRYDGMAFTTSLWLEPASWNTRPVILVDNLELKREANLDIKQKRFSHDELADNPAFVRLLEQAEVAKRETKGGRLQGLNRNVEKVGLRLADFESLRNGSLYRVVANPAGDKAPWMTISPEDRIFSAFKSAYLSGDPEAFSEATETFVEALNAILPEFHPPTWKLQLETIYQMTHPIRWAWICYLAGGIVLALTWIRAQRFGYVVGWSFVTVGLLLQIVGFIARIIIAERPPVTNMYESVIWVAFGTVLFALIFETIYRTRWILVSAVPVAVVSLILADSQPVALDRSIQPLVPVLQSNFWLTTHVLTITLSYAAFLLAVGVAHVALGHVIFRRTPSPALYNYIYRTLQVGVLLLAVGTILGGVWANYSWGRFWDWDPKETWALVALLSYLVILHGRLAGRWAGFGLAVGSILGFITIVMAWYGVNFVLGVGLHSYGFGSGGFGHAIGYVAFELSFIALAVFRKYTAPKNSKRAQSVAVSVS
jgi:ABC-type transport system involved in cytochrome c biogenesis permease subunit